VYLSTAEQSAAFDSLQDAVHEFQYKLLAVSIESWHVHWLIDHGYDAVATMVGRLKTRMRQHLKRGRIWTQGYDARYCFTEREVQARCRYIQRHRGCRKIRHEPPAPPAVNL